MPLRHANVVVLGSVLALLAVYLLGTLQGTPGEVGANLTRALFVATVAVEGLALWRAVDARRLFSPGDAGYRTWGLIVAFLAVRLVAEVRLITLTFDLVPDFITTSESLTFFYRVILRYLYTLSDVLFGAALVAALSSYRKTGLQFQLRPRDYGYMLAVWLVPAATFAYRENLTILYMVDDATIATYRLVAVLASTAIVSLCIAVRRFVLQMGGGALARVWNAVIAAGVARALSFAALALLSNNHPVAAAFTEQLLLWIFACYWLLAGLYQRALASVR